MIVINEIIETMRKVILLAVFAMLPIFVLAQQQYGEFLDAARKQLSEGRVELAEKSYNVWKEMTKETDLNFETELKKEKNKMKYAPLFQKAKQLYSVGNYIEAKDSLTEYTKQTGLFDSKLLADIIEGMTWAKEAKLALDRKDILTAKSCYEKILAVNPTDMTSARILAELNLSSRFVQTEKTGKKIRVVPDHNRFNMRVLSGFDQKTIIGIYLGGNHKMFHIGADIAFGSNYDIDGWQWVPQNYYQEEYAKLQNNTFSLNPNCYYSPKLQFSISPGVNLKYLSIECGLGAVMGNEYNYQKKYDEDYGYNRDKLEKTNKTYLLIRPVITGYIPTSKDHRGFSFSVGYNMVSGASPLNGVIFGVGFFI